MTAHFQSYYWEFLFCFLLVQNWRVPPEKLRVGTFSFRSGSAAGRWVQSTSAFCLCRIHLKPPAVLHCLCEYLWLFWIYKYLLLCQGPEIPLTCSYWMFCIYAAGFSKYVRRWICYCEYLIIYCCLWVKVSISKCRYPVVLLNCVLESRVLWLISLQLSRLMHFHSNVLRLMGNVITGWTCCTKSEDWNIHTIIKIIISFIRSEAIK